ncbi:ATP-dependent 6-phosphofructokinase-like isoform X2 [Biomphalaria glabrata]|uniref:6-phosphofructokinase n=1 Tax=Biomphalaria glabrata TaxID=6526 RepID=A0A9W2YFC8_BIOGL|nr:ATP-dependent 6-phosphofructokinase-like isoform X2 [Biomphalaria glabrata]
MDIEKLLKRRVSFEADLECLTMNESNEGENIVAGQWANQSIGVFTSGGDAQGMNAAVRAIVRVGMYIGCKVYYIKEGYQGMVDGGNNIQEATWLSSSNMIHMGGTLIGSARCMDFRERWGRLKAAQNLIQWGITNLIAIGGDGSLTGANCFRQEWPSLVRELFDKALISKEKQAQFSHLNIVGLVGSIDNDFCGTDMTIGVDTALHRILEAVDNIMTTAVSHKRAFVLEIMGRTCGYLALAAGIACEASVIFIPEDPPAGDWRQYLCDNLMEKSKSGESRRTHIVLVAEGAVDREGNPIKCNDVQKVLSDQMKMDVRVTVLGHVQRGGNASAFDRLLGSRMGAEAVLALMDAAPTTPACVICLDGSDIVRVPLLKAVQRTRRVAELMAERKFDEVLQLRGRPIVKNLIIYEKQVKVIPHPSLVGSSRKKFYRLAMIHVGQPACGMNAVARGFVSVCISKGYQPHFIYNSWEGLTLGKVKPITWNEVHHWTSEGGSLLGTSVETAYKIGLRSIATRLNEFDISGLIIVGGFEAFQSAYEIAKGREMYQELCIPIIVVPATIANNVPGCNMSIGCDTAINQICKSACSRIKNKQEFSGVKQGLIIRNENSNFNITTDFMYRLFNEEGKPFCTARQAILGHTQEGNKASPYDRAAGIKAGCRSTDWLINIIEGLGARDGVPVYSDSPSTVVVLIERKDHSEHCPVLDLALQTDFENRLPKFQWWLRLRNLHKILSWPTKRNEDKKDADSKSIMFVDH